MKLKISIYRNGENNFHEIDYPGTIKQYIALHFAGFGFYSVYRHRAGRYDVTDTFTGELLYTVEKA